MSIDQDFGPRLRIWLHERLAERPDPYPILDDVLAQLPSTPQQRDWRPVRVPTQHTVWSTAKAIVAISIVALFGGVLLLGILTTPQDDEALPAVTGSPSPSATEKPAFPTGTFVAEGDGLTLELRADGTCERAGVPCTFGVVGGLFVEMTFEDASGVQMPATYLWDFDGEQLTFEPSSIDKRPGREAAYLDHTYHPVGETMPLPDMPTDFPTGYFVPADGSGDPRLQFAEDGKWRGAGAGGQYVINGNLWTDARRSTAQTVKDVPATYYWRWDGERLTFRLWGEDDNGFRARDLRHVFVRDGEPVVPERRTILLSHPQLDVWARVEVVERDGGLFEVIATADEELLGEGFGDTLQEAVRAALEALGEPFASDMARSVTD